MNCKDSLGDVGESEVYLQILKVSGIHESPGSAIGQACHPHHSPLLQHYGGGLCIHLIIEAP